MIIYKTTNLINNKIYIGKDKKNNSKYLGSGKILKRAIKKYGKENFKKEILETCIDLEHLNEREKYWIEVLTPDYNIAKGGDGGDTFTNNPNKEKIRESYRESNKKHWENDDIRSKLLNRNITDLTKQKISEASKRMWENPERIKAHQTEEARNNNKEAQLKRFQDEKERLKCVSLGMKGKKHSEESKKKISDSNLGKTFSHSDETKEKIKKSSINMWNEEFKCYRRREVIKNWINNDIDINDVVNCYINGEKKSNIAKKYNTTYRIITTIIKYFKLGVLEKEFTLKKD